MDRKNAKLLKRFKIIEISIPGDYFNLPTKDRYKRNHYLHSTEKVNGSITNVFAKHKRDHLGTIIVDVQKGLKKVSINETFLIWIVY